MPRAHSTAAREVTRMPVRSQAPAASPRGLAKATAPPAQPLPAERVVIETARPAVECGTLPAKATAGLPLTVSATCFTDGHGLVMAWIGHGPADSVPHGGAEGSANHSLGPERHTAPGWEEVPMQPAGNDRFSATFTPPRVAAWAYWVSAMPDEFGTWLRDLRVRVGAGQDVALELEDGARMAERNAAGLAPDSRDRQALARLAGRLRDRAAPRPNGSAMRPGTMR